MQRTLFIEDCTLYYVTGFGYAKTQRTSSEALNSIAEILRTGNESSIEEVRSFIRLARGKYASDGRCGYIHIDSYSHNDKLMSIRVFTRGSAEATKLTIKLVNNSIIEVEE